MFLFTFMGTAAATFALGAFFSRMVADSWRVLPLVCPHSYTGSFSSLSQNVFLLSEGWELVIGG